MTAYADGRPQIPRVITKRPEPRPTVSLVTNPDIQFYSNGNRQIRYQHLPNSDPNESDEQIEKKLIERFALLEEFVSMAINGDIRSLILSGPGGVGKTFLSDKLISEWDPEGTKHSSHTGYSTPVGLLKMLYKNRHKGSFLKADDIDSIFNDEKSINLLKTACDTTKNRIITYASQATIEDEETLEVIPTTFPFEGTVMFSTNLDFEQLIDKGSKLSRHFDAFMTRSHYIDLKMRTKRDYLIRLFMVADGNLFDAVEGKPDEGIPNGLDETQKNDVLDFIEANYKILRECSLRMALKIGSLRKGTREDSKFTWDRMAMLSCCRGIS